MGGLGELGGGVEGCTCETTCVRSMSFSPLDPQERQRQETSDWCGKGGHHSSFTVWMWFLYDVVKRISVAWGVFPVLLDPL